MGGAPRSEVDAMSRIWIVRLIGILMILGFLLLFAHLQTRLMQLQQQRPANTTTR